MVHRGQHVVRRLGEVKPSCSACLVVQAGWPSFDLLSTVTLIFQVTVSSVRLLMTCSAWLPLT